MIQFMSPVIAPPTSTQKPGWMARFWRWRNPRETALSMRNTYTTEILDLIDRVRGAEALLERLKAEVRQCGRKS